ncbi:MAG: thiol-disulfide oxidoreductase DCC family protein [Acidimicrobiia bacterium]
MNRLTIVYDEHCAVCRRARDWLLTQPTFLPIELIAAGSPAARARFGGLPWMGKELVAADDQGNVWVGPAAFLTALWATRRYRAWSYRLAGDKLAPMARSFFKMVSTRRHRWSRFLEDEEEECSWCQNRPA